MARLPNTSTKAERKELHKAKMAGKKYDAQRRQVEITQSMANELTNQAVKRVRSKMRKQAAQ